MNNRNILIAISFLILAGLVSYFYFSGSGLPFQNKGEVVARVNGEEIMRKDLDAQIAQVEQNLSLQGQEGQLDDEQFRSQVERQVLDQLIAQVLIIQEAKKEAISVSSNEVELEYQNLVDSVGSEEALSQRLSQAGVEKGALREDIRKQLLIQKYLTAKSADQDFEVTDEEVVSFYDEWSSDQEEPPALEEVEEQIKDQLTSQKENQFISDLVTSLRENSDIEILL